MSGKKKPKKHNAMAMAPRVPIQSPPEQPWYEKNIVWGSVGLFGAPVVIALAAIFDIRWLLWGAWPFGAIAIWSVINPLKGKLRGSTALVMCVAMTYGLYRIGLMIPPGDLVLSGKDKDEFTKILGTAIGAPASTIISCPGSDENTCIFAANFIPLFQRAGWKIQGPQVERSVMGRPDKRVTFVQKGPPLVNPQDPDHGVWTAVSPFYQPVKTAFTMIGVDISTANDTQLPDDVVRVYFGAVPKRK